MFVVTRVQNNVQKILGIKARIYNQHSELQIACNSRRRIWGVNMIISAIESFGKSYNIEQEKWQ